MGLHCHFCFLVRVHIDFTLYIAFFVFPSCNSGPAYGLTLPFLYVYICTLALIVPIWYTLYSPFYISLKQLQWAHGRCHWSKSILYRMHGIMPYLTGTYILCNSRHQKQYNSNSSGLLTKTEFD